MLKEVTKNIDVFFMYFHFVFQHIIKKFKLLVTHFSIKDWKVKFYLQGRGQKNLNLETLQEFKSEKAKWNEV